jgi:hypothetical protein
MSNTNNPKLMVMGVSQQLTSDVRNTFKFTVIIESRDVIEDEIFELTIKTIIK